MHRVEVPQRLTAVSHDKAADKEHGGGGNAGAWGPMGTSGRYRGVQGYLGVRRDERCAEIGILGRHLGIQG